MSEARPARPWWLRWYALGPAILLSLPIAVLFGALALGFYKPFHVPSEAMSPTLVRGDRFIASFRGPGDLRRGDVIVFDMPDSIYTKRVAALPGDRIELAEGRIILNGRPVPQRFLKVERFETPIGGRQARRLAEQFPGEERPHHIYDVEHGVLDEYPETLVRPGHVFVLGDNRDSSADSRVPADQMGVEQLPIARIRGKALFHGLGSSRSLGESLAP